MLWINSHGWAEMFEAMHSRKTFFGKLRCMFGAPAMDFAERNNLKFEPEKLNKI